MYHLLLMYHVHIKVSTILGIRMFVTSFVETLHTIDTKTWNYDSSGEENRTISVAAVEMCLIVKKVLYRTHHKEKKF